MKLSESSQMCNDNAIMAFEKNWIQHSKLHDKCMDKCNTVWFNRFKEFLKFYIIT
jgi:hypothetical protein